MPLEQQHGQQGRESRDRAAAHQCLRSGLRCCTCQAVAGSCSDSCLCTAERFLSQQAARCAGVFAQHKLLPFLLDSGVPTQVYGAPIVRALIESKWHEFGKRQLFCQGFWFLLEMALFFAFQVGRSALLITTMRIGC